MTLKDFYKEQVYQEGWTDRNANKDPQTDSIYYEDEMDFYICGDYYGMYVGDPDSWSEEDANFLNALGFNTHDFEVKTNYE